MMREEIFAALEGIVLHISSHQVTLTPKHLIITEINFSDVLCMETLSFGRVISFILQKYFS